MKIEVECKYFCFQKLTRCVSRKADQLKVEQALFND